MTNASVTDSYLLSESSPDYDRELNHAINEWVRNITGIPEHLVRPLWQAKPPKKPEPNVDWCAFGVSSLTDENPFFNQVDTEQSTIEQNEEAVISGRFYGLHAQSIAMAFKACVRHPQNNYQLNKLGWTICSVSELRAFPEVVNGAWYRRFDLTITLRRRVERKYQVKTILSQNINIIGD